LKIFISFPEQQKAAIMRIRPGERQPDGKLPAPPHDETGHTWHHDDKTLFVLTKFGLSKLVGQHVPMDMPAYDGVLSNREIHAVLAYIKSRWPAHVRQRQTKISN
jgi:hypothetical protein